MKKILELVAWTVVVTGVMAPMTVAADETGVGPTPGQKKMADQLRSDPTVQGQGLVNEQGMKSQEPLTQAAGIPLRGDVLKIDGEFYTIHDTSGHDVRVHVNKSTKLGDALPVIVGDKIEAHVTSQGHALSMTHAAVNDQGSSATNAHQLASAPGTALRGDVLKIEGEFYTIHDTSGHEVRVHVNKSTKLDDALPLIVGDKVEYQVTPQGHALFMKHAQ